MGAKKKGKGSKLARMSEEERLRYLQHRAAIEEEARRRKEQLIATFMKNKLKREEAFSRLNIAKINQQWRLTLRHYKCIELKQDLEALFKWFVHTASKKTNQIDNLLNDMEQAELQYSRIYQCHMETIERLLDIHQQRINFFQRQYDQDLKEIYEKAMNEMETIISSCTLDQEHLEAILYRMEESHQMKVEKMEAKQTIKTDELRNNMLTELENLVVSREAKIEQLWQNMQKVLKDYWEGTEDRRRQYVTLRDADLENCKQIFMYHQQINNANELISSLKDQLATAKLNGEEKCAEVKKEKENCNNLFNVLRKRLTSDREKDKKNLIFLTSSAEDATKELRRILQKGEQILQVLSLCKKLEVLEDAINPYMTDKNLESENKEEEIAGDSSSKEKLAEDIVTNFSKLDKFWKRYNEVLIEKEILIINIKSLEEEQKELKNSLKMYISDMMTGKPSTKQARLTITRPLTCQVRLSSMALNQERAKSGVPCTEATQSPSIRHMIRAQSEK